MTNESPMPADQADATLAAPASPVESTSILSAEDSARLASILSADPAPSVSLTGADRILVQPREVFDFEGRQITENVVIQGKAPDGFARFIAVFTTPIKIIEKDPKGGQARSQVRDIPLRAKIDADSLAEAFDKFDDVAKDTAEKYVEELRAQHLRAQLALEK